MAEVTLPPEIEELISQFGEITDSRTRQQFFEENPSLGQPAVALRLAEQATKLAREDLHRAERMAEAAAWLAEAVNDDYGRARAWRAAGHILYLTGKHRESLERYQAALDMFGCLGNDAEAAITLSASLQPLAYLSQYSEAFARAQRAREIFQQRADHLRLARLEMHIGNILYRQDRFDEAIQVYLRAQTAFGADAGAQDIAPLLLNMAACYISLNEFAKSLDAYERLQALCKSHPMPLLATQADYNIAYLYYLRGEHTRAIELYQITRERCREIGDSYHQALCDLDQSDLYLELNLIEEGTEVAQSAFWTFQALRMGYEAAKAQANLALASFRQGRIAEALELFEDARRRFSREDNWIWPALIDLYVAWILHQQGKNEEARKKCEAAFQFFTQTSSAGKAAACQLLLARLDLAAGKQREALAACLDALQLANRDGSPVLRSYGHFLLGQVHEGLVNRSDAYHAYGAAQAALENVCSHVRAGELKVGFENDKLAVYESLVWLSLMGERRAEHQEAAFQYIEQAKSRQLADLIAFRVNALPAPSTTDNSLVERVQDLRGELSWDYRQLDLRQMKAEPTAATGADALRERARDHEAQLLKALAELRKKDAEFTSLQVAATAPLLAIRSCLPADTMLLEYFQARETFVGCCVTKTTLDIVPLAPAARLHELFRNWQRCVSAPPEDQAPDAAHEILNQLYRQLVLPLRDKLTARHLVICPDQFLYQLPFHALFDGKQFLIDQFTVSYAPSGSVFCLCRTKRRSFNEQSLILGVSRARRPSVAEEIGAVASVLPKTQILLGKQANEENLRDHGPASRFVHIASQGSFRHDNPMFSSIRIGDSELHLFDLYQRYLPCELVAITGCGEGFQTMEGGEGLLSLVHGLLYAGTETVLVTLWDPPGKNSGAFLRSFYQRLLETPNRALAMQQTILQFRATHPHPYYWAPFVLFGECRLA